MNFGSIDFGSTDFLVKYAYYAKISNFIKNFPSDMVRFDSTRISSLFLSEPISDIRPGMSASCVVWVSSFDLVLPGLCVHSVDEHIQIIMQSILVFLFLFPSFSQLSCSICIIVGEGEQLNSGMSRGVHGSDTRAKRDFHIVFCFHIIFYFISVIEIQCF